MYRIALSNDPLFPQDFYYGTGNFLKIAKRFPRNGFERKIIREFHRSGEYFSNNVSNFRFVNHSPYFRPGTYKKSTRIISNKKG